jgi:xylulokinase
MHQQGLDMSDLLLGFDVGTSCSKGVITDVNGNIVASHSIEHEIISPRPGWAEQDPEKHWWGEFVKIVNVMIRLSKVNPRDIKGICISGTMESLVFLDNNGRPLRNGILYLDNRAEIETKIAEKILGYSFTGDEATPKIMWIKKRNKNFSKIRMVLEPSNYIVYKLTGMYTKDYLLAHYFGGIYDLQKLQWNEEICNKLVIPVEILPPTYAASHVIGEVTANSSKETGLKKGTPVLVGTGDQFAQMLAVGVIEPKESLINYATTGVFLVCNTDLRKWLLGKNLSVDVNPVIIATYLPTMGALLKWFRDNFCPFETYLEKALNINAYRILDQEAREIHAGSDGLIVLPHFMGERNYICRHFDPSARGVIFGLTLHHTRKHVYRALLESFGYCIREGLISLNKLKIVPTRVVATGGGAQSELWTQIVSDITGMPQECIQNPGAPYGDAYLAGYGVGLFKNFETLRKRWVKTTKIIHPQSHTTYERHFARYQHLSKVVSRR